MANITALETKLQDSLYRPTAEEVEILFFAYADAASDAHYAELAQDGTAPEANQYKEHVYYLHAVAQQRYQMRSLTPDLGEGY